MSKENVELLTKVMQCVLTATLNLEQMRLLAALNLEEMRLLIAELAIRLEAGNE